MIDLFLSNRSRIASSSSETIPSDGAARTTIEWNLMATKLYVGNLTYDTTSQTLQQLFGEHGEVRSADVIMDRETGRSKGFGFVEMSNDQAAKAAINALNGQDVGGRSLTVNEARPREPRSGGGGGGGFRGGRY